MAGPETGRKKNIAYTITSGFYPELASRISWGKSKGKGKGAVGSKYHHKSGYANSSLRRMKSQAAELKKTGGKHAIPKAFRRPMPGKKKLLEDGSENPEFWSDSGYETGQAFIKRPKGTGKHLGKYFSPGQYVSKILGKGTPFNEDTNQGQLFKDAKEAGEKLQKVSYTKWMGGSELYKLYGTRVWYLEGERKQESIQESLDIWAKAIGDGNTSEMPQNYLNILYKDIESDLVILATEMAHTVFDEALDKAEIQKGLESVGRGEADVPEEEIAEARAGLEADMKDYARQSDLKIDKLSYANKLDALTRDKAGKDIYIDSTEMALTEDKGHGIVTATAAVKRAVENLKDGGNTEVLRKAVVEMFIKNITRDYNPAIRSMLKFMNKGEENSKKQQKKMFKDLLKEVEKVKKQWKKDAGKASKKGAAPDKISVKNIADVIGVRMGKRTTVESGGRTVNESAMRNVVHLLASLGDGTERYFRQGHRIASWPDGSRTYASIPMGINSETMEFYETGKMKSPHGTTILRGESHLLALAVANEALSEGKAQEIAQRQSQAHALARIHGSSKTAESMAFQGAQQDAKRKCHSTTRVSFSPKGLSDMMEQVMGMFYEDVGNFRATKGIDDAYSNIKPTMKRYAHSWPKGRQSSLRPGSLQGKQALTKTGLVNANRFWALPYIGINDNIYRGKGAVQK